MRKFLMAAAILLLLTPASWAGAYVGASLGQSDATVVNGPVSVDGDDTSWKILGGYTFMKFVGVEGSYRNFGGVDETIGTTSLSTEATSLDVFGVGILPLGKVELFAKAGFSRIDMTASVSDPLLPFTVSVSDDSNELAYGAGVGFGIGRKIAVRIEYEGFDTADSLNMFSAGALFKF